MTGPAEALCRLDELEDPGSMAAVAVVEGRERPVMIIRRGGAVFAYVNSCPHIGSPLDFTPGQFLDLEKTHIQCATHGAIFSIENGLCLKGPCVNASLEAIPVLVEKGGVFIDRNG